jgi:hypothetical protein
MTGNDLRPSQIKCNLLRKGTVLQLGKNDVLYQGTTLVVPQSVDK